MLYVWPIGASGDMNALLPEACSDKSTDCPALYEDVVPVLWDREP